MKVNRELKFRAWDRKRKEWYGASDPASLTFKGFRLFGECMMSCFPPIDDLEHIEVSQYTGLKDKNGKEIYEGDIVSLEKTYYKRSSEYEYCKRLEEHSKEIKNYIVEWDKGQFIFSGEWSSYGVYNFWIWNAEKECYSPTGDFNIKPDDNSFGQRIRFLGIIGNIYENPELLEVEND